MNFYECVKVYPEGSSSASRMALTARNLGYKGIIICNCDPTRIFMLPAAERVKGIEIAVGVEVVASNVRALKSRIGALRIRYPFLAVRAATDETVHIASEDPNLDLLVYPCDVRRPLSIATARAAKANQVSIGFDISPLIHLRGSPRARWLQAVSRNLQLVRKFHLSCIITTGARSYLDLRSPRDLAALAEVAGFSPEEAEVALNRHEFLLAQNRRHWVGPGVEML
jgi:ribonuclease P/MRP protein subunit RPP1